MLLKIEGNCFLHSIREEKPKIPLKKWGAYKITFWISFSGTQ